MLLDLNVGPVISSDNKSGVHDKLHVGGAGCFSPGGGNMLGDVVGGDNDLSVSDLVVGDEDELEIILGIRVGVDHGSNGIAECNNSLRDVVSSGSLASNEDSLLLDFLAVSRAHALQPLIPMDNLEDVEELPLVLVNTFDLDVEHGRRVDLDVQVMLHIGGQSLLIFELCVHNLLLDLWVFCKLLEACKQTQILDPFVIAKALGDDG
mmetsp:Transcript_33260/g.51758  ORF Transcript_33260/g.51758 Transcript_33260/m.51758 type:complete len:207 (-) Transcript_33260:643-1263(-)